VRDQDVAEGGSEEDAGKTAGQREAGNPASGNRFLGINDEDTGDDEGWKQAAGGKKWSNVVNETSASTNGQKAKQQHKESMKENKVAYLLFYQRI
jgi:ubiquitin carboxyl-terminal hydrolase 10